MESLQSLMDAIPSESQSSFKATETSYLLNNKSLNADAANTYKRKYQSLLKRFQDLQRDQEDTFTIHADTVIKLQDKIKQKELLIKRANMSSVTDAWSDSEYETSVHQVRNRNKSSSSRSNLRNPPTTNTTANPPRTATPSHSQLPAQTPPVLPINNVTLPLVGGGASLNSDQDRLVEILKTKVDIMRLSIEEASRQYGLLHQQDQETIAFLGAQVAELKENLNHSANQVALLSSTSSDLKRHLQRILDGIQSTHAGLESHKQEHEQQLQQLREIYVSETQAGIKKNTKINQLHATINDKNREIAVLRGWLSRIKRELRDSEVQRQKALPKSNT